MAEQIVFSEGRTEIGTNGFPATVYFLLSTKDCDTHALTDTLAGGVGEISGTGYSRQSQSRPTGSNGSFAFTQMSWATGSATDWPADVKSIVACTTSNNTGKALWAQNLVPGGTARDMSLQNTTESFTPTAVITE